MPRNSSRSTAKPFTSRDLLDHIYAPILPVELHHTDCACGAHRKFVRDDVSVWFCNEQGCRARQDLIPLLDHDRPDPMEWHVVVKKDHYEWFAGRWWLSNVLGERREPVADWNTCVILDKFSGRKSARPVKPLQKIGKQYRETIPKKKTSKVKSCWCVPLGAHSVLSGEQLAMNCPVHGSICNNCGGDHHK